MTIPITYTLKNLWVRKITTCLTMVGLGLVVFVFSSILMLDQGLKKTLVNTGEKDNIIVIRKGADTEVQSGIYRNQAAIIETSPFIENSADGTRNISKELVVLISMQKNSTGKFSNVVVRGSSKKGLDLRPQINIVRGRTFEPGTSEVIIGRAVAKLYGNLQIGDSISFAQRKWNIVGIFDAKQTAFDSEIWGDCQQLMQAFRRTNFSIVIFKSKNSKDTDSMQNYFNADPQLAVQLKIEQDFYEDQSKALSKFINILGITLTVIFSIGATIGAMITMNAAVSNRIQEIGTLRALGFKRKDVLTAFLLESVSLGLLGGIIGISAANFMELSSFTTTNFQTFAELSFGFVMTPTIAVKALLISVLMGSVGGLLPAIYASNLEIVESLRSP